MRTVWFVAGTAAGVYASAKARRAREELSVEGVHDRLTGWFAGARVLATEVRSGMQVKEAELRLRLAAAEDAPPTDNVVPLDRDRHLELTGPTSPRKADH